VQTDEQPDAPKYDLSRMNNKKASFLKSKIVKNPFLAKQSSRNTSIAAVGNNL